MNFSVENNLTTGYVNNSKVSLNSNPVEKKGLVKTSQTMPDSFDKKNILPNFSQAELLHQKLLETVSPNTLLNNYLKPEIVDRMVFQNPEIKSILRNNKVDLSINVDNVKELVNSHLNSTVDYSLGIAEELDLSRKDKDIIAKGALFHDFGKILIPQDIIGKKDKLTSTEKRIIDLHSVLGEELLKTTSLDKNILTIVGNHHKPLSKSPDLRTQIVTVADIYSALTTERAYKGIMTPERSFQILDNYAEMGKINPLLVEALKHYVGQSNSSSIEAA